MGSHHYDLDIVCCMHYCILVCDVYTDSTEWVPSTKPINQSNDENANR